MIFVRGSRESPRWNQHPRRGLLIWRPSGLMAAAKGQSLTSQKQIAFGPRASVSVIDGISVALVEARCRTEAPDGFLHKARKVTRECGIEAPSVYSTGNPIDDLFTATITVASSTLKMRLAQPSHDARPPQPVMDQRIDCNHCRGRQVPSVPPTIGQQQAGQCHLQDLVRYPMHVEQRADHGVAQQLRP